MAGINLLPTDLAPKASVVKASGAIKKLTTFGIAVLVLSLVISIGLYLTFTSQLRVSTLRAAQLGESIRALETTEQMLILIKDRLALAQEVLAKPTASDEIASAQSLINSFPQDVSLQELTIEQDLTSTSIIAENSTALTQVLATLISGGIYKSVELTSLSFLPATGFKADFDLVR